MDSARKSKDLAAHLVSSDLAHRRSAAEQLSRLESAAQHAAVALVTAAGDDDAQVREHATGALESLGPPNTGDVPALAEILTSPSAERAYWAATLLGRAGPLAASATGALADSLGAERPLSVRERAAWALGKIGPEAQRALPALKTAAAADLARLKRLAELAIEAIEG